MKRLQRPFSLAAAALVVTVLAGCTLGPNYKRPQMPAPPQHRFVEGPAEAESIADVPWWEVVEDPHLVALIRDAIANNLDLQVAAARVEEARAVAGISKSFLYPQVGFGAGYGAGQLSGDDEKTFQNWDAGFTLSWEIDLFGRIRRTNEAAFARYLATEQGRRGVLITLVADVASNYLLLRQLDLELEVARRTVESNDETVIYFVDRLEGGASNRLEVDQAVANRSRTAITIPDIEAQIAFTENVLSLLLGRMPGPIERGAALEDQHLPPAVPAGIPAALLERRPDVMAAEQLLVAANANVGAAKALFYPSISLTGLLGGLSRDLGDITQGDAAVWNLSAGLLQPIFQGGRLKRNYEASQARFQQAMGEYRRAALDGYREVADSLVLLQKLGEKRGEIQTGVDALRDAALLSRARYDSGLSSYIEILLADRDLYEQERLLAQTRGEEMRAFVRLYRALGGGWQPEPETTAPSGTSP